MTHVTTYKHSTVPVGGERIEVSAGAFQVPDKPIIPFIEGDGTGADIWRASVRVFDAAVERAYAGKKKVHWMEVLAGQKAFDATGEWMPAESLEAVREFKIAIKGPLTTPVGGGIRSLNVALRQELDLYACIRPVRYFEGVGSPMKDPGKVNIVIFRENIEDVYSGIEFKSGSAEAEKLRQYLKSEFKKNVREGSAIGIKPMSPFGSKRLVEMAIRYAI
jgi:isocitrate dehydrogenase